MNINSLKIFQPRKNILPDEKQLSIFYTNDIHGEIGNLARLKTAKDIFEKQNSNIPTLTLSSGDCYYGKENKSAKLITKLLNAIKTDAITLGNHEFSAGTKILKNRIDKLNCKCLSANLDIDKKDILQQSIKKKKLVKSATFMKGGEKFAIIGISPVDSDINTSASTIKPYDINKTIHEINKETQELKNKGFNKIILCSHVGYGEDGDLKIAKETDGVDIIIGGHSHNIIDGINTETKDKTHPINCVMSKSNEPVLITQAGKGNKYAGFLNVVFDKNGIIKPEKSINQLNNLSKFEANKEFEKEMAKFLGKNKTLAKLKNIPLLKNEFAERFQENKLHNLLAEAVLEEGKKYGVQASFINSLSAKGNIQNDKLTLFDVKYSLLPYNETYCTINISEKDLVDMLNKTGENLFDGTKDPLLLRACGVKYSLSQDNNGKLTELYFNNKNTKTPVDVKNPQNKKTYKIAIENYLFNAPSTKEILKKYKNEAKILSTQQDILLHYLKNHPQIDFNKIKNNVNIYISDISSYCSQYSLEEKSNQ